MNLSMLPSRVSVHGMVLNELAAAADLKLTTKVDHNGTHRAGLRPDEP